MNRRSFIQLLGGTAAVAASGPLLAACSSGDDDDTATTGDGKGGGKAGKRKLTLGFIPLTDCAPLVIAKEKGFFDAHDLDVTLENGKSWPEIRDKLLNGEFDAAHALFSMPFAVATGVSKIEGAEATAKSLRVAMMLNQNGQGITLASDLADAGYNDLDAARETIRAKGAKSFGVTFPGGTHDAWLRYWLKAAGLDPSTDGLDIKPIPPPDMFANLNQENVRGYCVGEPWNARAVMKEKGFTTLATQDLWKHHPEKALLTNARFVEENEASLRDVMLAVFEACAWLDDKTNVAEAAAIIGVPKYVNATPDEIEGRLGGVYDMGAGIGTRTYDEDRMRFLRDGEVNFPRKSWAMWFMAQYVRFGYLDELPDARTLADEMILTDLYAEVAATAKIDVPDDDLAPFTIDLDGATFDPAKASDEAVRP